MHKKDDFLIEIGTEELPAKSAKLLSEMLASLLEQHFIKENFTIGKIETFSTPRRIAVLIHEVDERQPDKTIEKKGPSLTVAIDKDQKPTAAGLGFARSCGVDFAALEIQQGVLFHRFFQAGKTLIEIAPSIVKEAIHGLHHGKTMRWNAFDIEFLRPVHWIVLMYGSQVIPAEILNLPTTQQTFGHRFHHPEKLLITDASQYESILETQGQIIPSFEKRRAQIQAQIQAICTKQDAQVVANEALLNEVTGLVEWPVAYLATYAEDFLTLPREALISAIEQHQKCFPMENQAGELKPYFIAVSNIQSHDPSQIIVGNERVMRARLSDAAFFYHTDKKRTLESRLDELKTITFQVNLGSLLDKTHRLASLAAWIGAQWLLDDTEVLSIPTAIGLLARRESCEPPEFTDVNEDGERLSQQRQKSKGEGYIQRAGLLAKTDLATDMVREFPELQGIMGYYYALQDKESADVATAICEHYLPKFSGDTLPSTSIGCALAIADRMDNLVGIFSLGQIPSGDKDPFGLKRAAMGICRILIEKALPISLNALIEKTTENYNLLIKNTNFIPLLKTFIIERLRAWYSEKGISSDIFNAVVAIQNDEPLDIHHRIMAVEHFKHLPQAQALTAANKRVSNILDQAEFHVNNTIIEPDPQLFDTEAEKNLYLQIKQLETADAQQKQKYTHRLTEFASLQPCVDQFFDGVMVMVSDDHQRNNRLQLLAQLRSLFLQIADISVLQI